MNMRYASTIPTILRRAALGLALCLTAGAARAQEHPSEQAAIRALLDRAALRFDIPRPILYGVSYAESRWRHDTTSTPDIACAGRPPVYGVMGLHDDDHFGHSLRSGGALGIAPETAARDLEANITVGAAYLSSLFEGSDREDVTQWLAAIGRYSGIPDSEPALRELYIDGVAALLRAGWEYGGGMVTATPLPTPDRSGMLRRLAAMGIVAGADYPSATWQPSPNFSSRNGAAITAITIHDTEGEFAGSVSWLRSTESEASAHYIIRSSDGFVVQMVAETDKAWHVRSENPYTIGIEHEGFAAKPEYFTQRMYTASADLVRYLAGKYGIPLDRTRIKGHLDFPNNTHTDPGGWWDWPGYYRLIARNPSLPVVLDRFEDTVVGWWQPAQSGSTIGVDPAGTTFDISRAAAHEGSSGGSLRYAFTAGSGGVARVFRSGHGNTSDGLLSLGASTGISLMARGDGGGNELELWLYDAAKNNVILPLGRVDWRGWRKVSGSITGLAGIGPFRFHSIVLRQTATGSRSGTIAVDALTAERGTSGVAAEFPIPRPAPTDAPSMAIAGGKSLEEILPDAGPVRIYSMLGREVASFDAPPSAPVGGYLTPGIYLLATGAGRIAVSVLP